MNADLPVNQNYLVPTLDGYGVKHGDEELLRYRPSCGGFTPVRYDFGAVIPDQHIINLPFPTGI